MVVVRDASARDRADIADALVSAFHDDPVMLHIFRSDRTRPRRMGALFRHEAGRALRRGALHAATTGTSGAVVGAAIWMAPGRWRSGGVELLRQFPLVFATGTATPRSLRVLARMEEVHPTEPHWYLAMVGTATDHQGKGVGSALLRPVLERCDTEGVPAYLESTKQENIPFYRRHGFEATGEVTVHGGPTLWPMWREPRPG